MTSKQPWRCLWCVRLNKATALRCRKCDYQWHQCIDHSFVPGGRGQPPQQWNTEEWHQPDTSNTRKSTKSPRRTRRRSATPKKKQNQIQNAYAVPGLDPPWSGQGGIVHASTSTSAMSTTELQAEQRAQRAEQKLSRVVAALEKQDVALDPEAQQIVEEETNTKTASSKQMHSAVSKLDQARKKFQNAQKARQTHQDKWTTYLEASIKRWQTFAEDFAKQDKDLEDRVNQARTKMQEARALLDDTKERLLKQDVEVLKEAEVISDMEDEMDKMETSDKIQAGIHQAMDSLAAIRVRPPEGQPDEVHLLRLAPKCPSLSRRLADRLLRGLPIAKKPATVPDVVRQTHKLIHPLTTDQLLDQLGLQQFCQYVQHRCLIWHNNNLVPLSVNFLDLRDGDYLRIAIPPGCSRLDHVSTRCLATAFYRGMTPNEVLDRHTLHILGWHDHVIDPPLVPHPLAADEQNLLQTGLKSIPALPDQPHLQRREQHRVLGQDLATCPCSKD
eukprot:s386_g26.t1